MSDKYFKRVASSITSRFSPVAIVFTAACLLLGGSVLFRYYNPSTIDPQVNLDGNPIGVTVTSQKPRPYSGESYGDNDPSARYADRLRDASALSLSFSLYALNQRLINQRSPQNVGVVLNGMSNAALLPPGLSVLNPSGVVRSPFGLYYIRYRPEPFGVEVLSVGANGVADGEIFLIRLPETAMPLTPDAGSVKLAGSYATIFVAPQTDGLIPRPFAPAPVFIKAGWRQEQLRAAPYSPQQVAELKTWLAQYQKDGMK